MNDITNCGSFGYICTSNYTLCTLGLCSGLILPPVLTNVTDFIWDGRISIDDSVASLHLPLNITLYNYSSDNLLVSSNGVRVFSHSLDRSIDPNECLGRLSEHLFQCLYEQ